MNESMDAIDHKVKSLNSMINQLFLAMSRQKSTRSAKKQIEAYEKNNKGYTDFLNNGEIHKALSLLTNMVYHSERLRHLFSNSPTLANNITAEQKHLITLIEHNTEDLKYQMKKDFDYFKYSSTFQEDTEINKRIDSSNDSIISKQFKKEMELIKEDHEQHDQRHQKLIADNFKRLNAIEDKTMEMQSLVEDKLERTNRVYDETMERLKEKERNINELLGIVTNKKIAGKYEESAAEEKVFADWLRYASIFCMIMIVTVVGYSFWETTTTDFKWENSIFRIVLAFLLSVPAAYLARESAKHREQQYNHLQTSLDLNAIDPYVASLLPEQQSQIKIDIAGRIFAAKDYSKVSQTSYPLNTNELLMALLKKIDFKTQTAGATKPEKG